MYGNGINYNDIHINNIMYYMGVKGDWDFWISDLVRNPDGTDV